MSGGVWMRAGRSLVGRSGFGASGVPLQSSGAALITPLLHITLPDNADEDEYDEERHFAPIILAVQAVVAVNEWHMRRALRRTQKGLGVPIPPLYASGVRYKEDPPGHENWKDCLQVLKDGHGDCLPLSTLVLRDDFEAVPLYDLRPGDRIMGHAAWTEVRESVMTGEKEILSFKLSNGCTLRCSRDHRLFRDVDGRVEEIRAEEARVGDDLIQLETLPKAPMEDLGWPETLSRLSDAERAWVLGVFVADGWTQTQNPARGADRCAVSGQDGKPKEEQKRRVEQLMASVGVPTRWHAKYIAINDRDVASFFERCGKHAPNKRLDSLRFASEETVRAVLDGLSADASFERREGKTPGIVYGTTSPQLVLQLRVLYRMLGISVSIRRVDDHGGFGEHPIYRVTPRLQTREGFAERREKKFARIRAITDGGVALCGDIQTDSGKFWLPESDVVVHNCDRLVSYRAAELRVAGIAADPVIKWQQVPKNVMVSLGHPAQMVPEEGISMVHVCVGWPGWQQDPSLIEDPSKELGMGGEFTSGV